MCDERTPPIIQARDIEAQLEHQVLEAAIDWYGENHEPPYHPPPVGKKWDLLVKRLAQLRDARRP